jgi:hypothetical protein
VESEAAFFRGRGAAAGDVLWPYHDTQVSYAGIMFFFFFGFEGDSWILK